MQPLAEPGSPAALARRLAVAALAALLLAVGSAAAQNDPADKGAKPGAREKQQEKDAKGGKKDAKGGKDEKPSGPPKLDASAWILVDALDGEVLASHAPNRELPIASATKLMTAQLALKQLDPDQRLKAPAYDALAAESLLGLAAGEKMTVRDLLYALLLPSANDAAETIAVGVAGNEKRFVAEMNQAAVALGLDRTHYANPIGLDAPGNHSSAADLADLADRLLANRLFARIVDTPEAVLRSGSVKRTITTRNTLLLSEPWVVGVKTGHTTKAGYVLVAAGKRNGTTLISAVLGARSEAARDAETKKLLDYGFSQYRARVPVRKGEELADPELDYRDDRLSLVAKRDVPVSVRRGQRLSTTVVAPDEVEGPVDKGEPLGRVLVRVDGRVAGGSPLVASGAEPAATLLQKAVATAAQPLILIPAGLFVIVVGLLLAVRGRGDEEPEPTEPPATKPEPPKAKVAEKPSPPQPEEPKPPKEPRLRRNRKQKGPPRRTPDERRQMAEERARRRKERGG